MQNEGKKKGTLFKGYMLWRTLVSLCGLCIILYEAFWSEVTDRSIVMAALLMMGFPITRYIDTSEIKDDF